MSCLMFARSPKRADRNSGRATSRRSAGVRTAPGTAPPSRRSTRRRLPPASCRRSRRAAGSRRCAARPARTRTASKRRPPLQKVSLYVRSPERDHAVRHARQIRARGLQRFVQLLRVVRHVALPVGRSCRSDTACRPRSQPASRLSISTARARACRHRPACNSSSCATSCAVPVIVPTSMVISSPKLDSTASMLIQHDDAVPCRLGIQRSTTDARRASTARWLM